MYFTSNSTADDSLGLFLNGTPILSPAQNTVAVDLAAGLSTAAVNVLRVPDGMGRTTILRALHSRSGGVFLKGAARKTQSSFEETFIARLSQALESSNVVFIDDLHLLAASSRRTVLDRLFASLLDQAVGACKKLVFALNGEIPLASIGQRAVVWCMPPFTLADYRHIAEHYLGPAAVERIDLAHIHALAPCLTAGQIRNAGLFLGLRDSVPDTAAFLAYVGVSTETRSRCATC